MTKLLKCFVILNYIVLKNLLKSCVNNSKVYVLLFSLKWPCIQTHEWTIDKIRLLRSWS